MHMNINSEKTKSDISKKIASVPYWFHRIELAPDVFTPGEDDSPTKLVLFDLPKDLTGKRVLDIGAYDGFFSFECERRGASEVIAIDYVQADGFKVAHDILNSQVKFQQLSIYDLNSEDLGQFDLVLCLGVIYHLRHPLLGLERIYPLCRDLFILETQICDGYFIDTDGKPKNLNLLAPALQGIPIAQFYPGAELNNDPSNWWSPNQAALEGMIKSCGFVPQKAIQNGVRSCMHCTIGPNLES